VQPNKRKNPNSLNHTTKECNPNSSTTVNLPLVTIVYRTCSARLQPLPHLFREDAWPPHSREDITPPKRTSNKTWTLKTPFWVKTKTELNSPTWSRLASLNDFTEFTLSLSSLLKNQVYYRVNSVRVCGHVNSYKSTSWLTRFTTLLIICAFTVSPQKIIFILLSNLSSPITFWKEVGLKNMLHIKKILLDTSITLSQCQFSWRQIKEPWLVYADNKYRTLISVSLSHKLTKYSLQSLILSNYLMQLLSLIWGIFRILLILKHGNITQFWNENSQWRGFISLWQLRRKHMCSLVSRSNFYNPELLQNQPPQSHMNFLYGLPLSSSCICCNNNSSNLH